MWPGGCPRLQNEWAGWRASPVGSTPTRSRTYYSKRNEVVKPALVCYDQRDRGGGSVRAGAEADDARDDP